MCVCAFCLFYSAFQAPRDLLIAPLYLIYIWCEALEILKYDLKVF